MALFNRKKKREGSGNDENGERKKEKGSWRRPASESRAYLVLARSRLPPRTRYRLQAAASQSMAANFDPENCSSNAFHNRDHLRPNRCPACMGKQSGRLSSFIPAASCHSYEVHSMTRCQR